MGLPVVAGDGSNRLFDLLQIGHVVSLSVWFEQVRIMAYRRRLETVSRLPLKGLSVEPKYLQHLAFLNTSPQQGGWPRTRAWPFEP